MCNVLGLPVKYYTTPSKVHDIKHQNISFVKMDSYKCVECSNPREIINVNCLHCSLCADCFGKRKKNNVCPHCGCFVNKFIRMYVNQS